MFECGFFGFCFETGLYLYIYCDCDDVTAMMTMAENLEPDVVARPVEVADDEALSEPESESGTTDDDDDQSYNCEDDKKIQKIRKTSQFSIKSLRDDEIIAKFKTYTDPIKVYWMKNRVEQVHATLTQYVHTSVPSMYFLFKMRLVDTDTEVYPYKAVLNWRYKLRITDDTTIDGTAYKANTALVDIWKIAGITKCNPVAKLLLSPEEFEVVRYRGKGKGKGKCNDDKGVGEKRRRNNSDRLNIVDSTLAQQEPPQQQPPKKLCNSALPVFHALHALPVLPVRTQPTRSLAHKAVSAFTRAILPPVRAETIPRPVDNPDNPDNRRIIAKYDFIAKISDFDMSSAFHVSGSSFVCKLPPTMMGRKIYSLQMVTPKKLRFGIDFDPSKFTVSSSRYRAMSGLAYVLEFIGRTEDVCFLIRLPVLEPPIRHDPIHVNNSSSAVVGARQIDVMGDILKCPRMRRLLEDDRATVINPTLEFNAFVDDVTKALDDDVEMLKNGILIIKPSTAPSRGSSRSSGSASLSKIYHVHVKCIIASASLQHPIHVHHIYQIYDWSAFSVSADAGGE